MGAAVATLRLAVDLCICAPLDAGGHHHARDARFQPPTFRPAFRRDSVAASTQRALFSHGFTPSGLHPRRDGLRRALVTVAQPRSHPPAETQSQGGLGTAPRARNRRDARRSDLAPLPDRGREPAGSRGVHAGRRTAERGRSRAGRGAGREARDPGSGPVSVHGSGPARSARLRSLAGRQSRVPGLPGHQGRGPRDRPPDRCRARPLHEPRPRRASRTATRS